MRHKNRQTDFRDYKRRPSMTENDRLEAIDIIERHFPDISPDNVYRVTVAQENGYAIVKVYRYAQHHETGGKFIDETTRDVAVLPVVMKTFPASGLL